MEDYKTKETKIRERLLAKYHNVIFDIIKEAERARGNFSLTDDKIMPRKPWWKSGVKACTHSYTIEGTQTEEGGYDRYLAKIVPMKFGRDICTELAVLDKSEDNSRIASMFAPLAGYRLEKDHAVLVLKLTKHRSLYEEYARDIVIPLNNLLRAVTISAQFNNLKENDEEVLRLNQRQHELSWKIFGVNGVSFGLDQLSDKDYIKFFMKYSLFGREVPKKVADSVKEPAMYLIKKFLTKPDFMRLIQHDAHPGNHLGDCLVDAGDVKIGSPGMQLGRLLGHPRIYNKLFANSDSRNTDKIDNVKECMEQITEHYARLTDLNSEEVRLATYFGQAYGNIRLLPGKDFTIYEKNEFMRASLEQLLILGEDEEAARQLRRALISAWEIDENAR